ncbi:MAG: hypothetical protein M1829_003293 [Trizodia sp. TS-e1964]|nr:MAG: hypothetical protein M1829_003293 [Trizodia sp. TS-e1964]
MRSSAAVVLIFAAYLAAAAPLASNVALDVTDSALSAPDTISPPALLERSVKSPKTIERTAAPTTHQAPAGGTIAPLYMKGDLRNLYDTLWSSFFLEQTVPFSTTSDVYKAVQLVRGRIYAFLNPPRSQHDIGTSTKQATAIANAMNSLFKTLQKHPGTYKDLYDYVNSFTSRKL